MADRSDINAADDGSWDQAVEREAVVRRLAEKPRIARADFLAACLDLGIRRSRLYELIRAYKARPLTSSLLGSAAGIQRGARRLPEEVEAVISEAIEKFFKSRQKPSINALHKEVHRRCRLQNTRAPCWSTLRDRVAAMDPAELTAARDGTKAARSQYRPVPGIYQVERAYEVVQIDHTPVDVIVVDRVDRKPLQRPWLTLAIDVASRMVAGFYLTEHRRAQALLRERGQSLEDEQLIFEVIEEQRTLIDAASGKTRQARRAAERRDRALDGAGTYDVEETAPEPRKKMSILDHPGFEVEEWS